MSDTTFMPFNRYILVKRPPPLESSDSTGILLPDEYKKTQSLYETVTVVRTSPNCAFKDRIKPGSQIVVLTNFLEEIEIAGDIITVVLENHVFGKLSCHLGEQHGQ